MKKFTSLLLSFCLILSLLPVNAFAVEEQSTVVLPKQLAAVTTTTSIQTIPEGATTPGDVTITTANLFQNSTSPRIYLEFSGLQPNTAHEFTVFYGEKAIGETYSSSNADGVFSWSVYPDAGVLPVDQASELTITIGYDRTYVDGAYVCNGVYKPAAITTHLVSTLPELSLEELNSGHELISTADLSPNGYIYLPVSLYDTFESASDLNAALVGADGTIYATTVNYTPSFGSSSTRYPGYDELFTGSFSTYIETCYFSTNTLYAAKPFVSGLYDLEIYDGNTLLYTVEDLFQAVDCPLITALNAGAHDTYATIPGMKEARVQVNLSNGNPNDFTAEVWYEGEMLGSSNDYRVTNAYDEYITAIYVIPLNKAIDYGSYTVKLVSDQTFAGPSTNTFSLSKYSTYRSITDAAFGSRYYGNILLTTLGYNPDETYQALLYAGNNTSGTPLSTVYVSPDVNGLFDIEFTDESGSPISISGYDSGNVNGHYCVQLRCWNEYSNAWETYGNSKNLSNYERYMVEESISLMNSEETIPVTSIGSSAMFYSEDAYVYLRLSSTSENYDTMTDISKFSLRISDVLGNIYTLTRPTDESAVETSDNGEKYYLVYFLTENIPHGYYSFELLYDNIPVVHSKNEQNVLSQTYLSSNDDFPYVQVQSSQNQYTGLISSSGIYGYNLTAETLQLNLFSLTNRSTTPDVSLTVSSPADREHTNLSPEQLAKLSPITAYRSEIYCDGKPISADSYTYFVSWDDDNAWTDPDDRDTYSVSAAQTENGVLTILPATVPSAKVSAIPAYTDVYILAQPDEGYRLKAGSISVNGEKLLGRGFHVTEDAVVSAEFEVIPAETYAIKVNTSISTGTIFANKEKAAAGETVTVTFTPKEGYVLNRSNLPYYILDGDTTHTPVPLTENADGTWSFIMPAGKVSVEGSFRQIRNWTITTTSNNDLMGTVAVSNATPPESSTVIVTVVPETGYGLFDLTWTYKNAQNNSVSGDLTITPGEEPNTYILTLPSKDDAYGYSPTMTVNATFSARQSYYISYSSSTSHMGSVSYTPDSIYAGDIVSLTIQPYDGYMLSDGFPQISCQNTGTHVELTKVSDTTWTFVMPEQNVNLFYEFAERPLFVPGGTVTSPETLQTALGGTGYASLKDGVVTLDSSVILQNALNITAGSLVLDLNGKQITGPDSATLLQLSGTTDLKICNNNATAAASLRAAAGHHAVLVNNGKLNIQADRIDLSSGMGSTSFTGVSVATVCVKGGVATLGSSDTSSTVTGFLIVEECTRTASALEISGGSVNIMAGDFCGDTGILVKNSGSLFMHGGYGECMGNGAAIQVDSTATGTIKLYKAKLHGSGHGLIIDSSSAAVYLEQVSVSADDIAFRAPSGKGLKNYLANGYVAYSNDAERLTDAQLSSSSLTDSFMIAKSYSITVSEAEHGQIWVESTSCAPSFEAVVSVKPDLGYELDELTYTYTKDDELMSGVAMFTPGMGYWFPMPESDVIVSATFSPIPEGDFLHMDRFSIYSSNWSCQLNVPVNLDYNTSYLSLSLVDGDGKIVHTQENHGSSTWMDLNNPGNLPTGTYKLYATVGDAAQIFNLGWQSVELVDAYSYNAHPHSGSLTIWTSSFDANVFVECLPSQLPNNLTLELVELGTGRILASSKDYIICYEGGSADSTASGKNDEGPQSHLQFHLNLGSNRADASASYMLRLSGAKELLNRDTNTLNIQSYPTIQGDTYDADSMTWTGTAWGIPAGNYAAYNDSNMITGLNCVVSADGTASLQFSSDPFEIINSNWIYIYVDVNGTTYGFGFSNGQNQNHNWYQMKVEDLVYIRSSTSYTYIDSIISYPVNGVYTLEVNVPGYTGGGRFQLDGTHGTISTEYLSDLSSFSVLMNNVAANENYWLYLYDNANNNIGSISFQFRHDLALGLVDGDDFYDGDNQITFRPVNMTPAQINTISLGYISLDGRHPFPYITNADGTITVDTSSLPNGRFRLWAQCTSGDGGTCNPLITTNTLDSSDKASSNLYVADLKVEKEEDGTLTAPVKYEGGAPDSDVLMDIFHLKDGMISFVVTKNIGKTNYSINSGDLGLSGSYVFYFRSSADNSLLGVKSADFVGSYSVTFLDWDGSIISIQQVVPNGAAEAPDNPVRTGYTFTGWSQDFSHVTKNMTVSARYMKDSVTVSFFIGSGSGSFDPVTLNNGSLLILPEEDPVREGYAFTGWFTDPSCTMLFDSSKTITRDCILYAGWTVQNYKITFGNDTIRFPSDTPPDQLFYAGDNISIEIDNQSARITALKILDREGNVLQELPCVQTSFALWTANFTMPAQDVVIQTETELYPGQLTINCLTGDNFDTLQVYCPETMYSVYYTSLTAGLTDGMMLRNIPLGTYHVTATSGSITWNESVMLSAETPKTYLNLSADDRYDISGTVSGAVGADTTLYVYDAVSGIFAGFADYDYKSNTFTFFDLANGAYNLFAYDQSGQLLANVTSFTVADADLTNQNIILSQPLSVMTMLDAPETLGDTAYLVLEQQTSYGWDWLASMSGESNNVTFCFDYAITEPGTYRVRLDWLTNANYTGTAFLSDPVEFEITDAELAQGIYYTDNLTYTQNLDVMDAFSGPGNLVALSKNEVYPGDYVELSIRYNAPSAVAPTFSLSLPEGSVTRLDNTSLSVTKPAQNGTIVLALKVDKDASGALAIPVQVTLNGKTTDFGTAAMSVAGVTLSASPSTKAGEPFTVYGEAASGSTVSIVNADNNTLLATVPVSGRFYTTSVALPYVGNYHLEARVASGGNLIKSSPVTVVVESDPISINAVQYNYSSITHTGTTARENPKLNMFSFWQYVDLDLMGFDLPLAVSFANGENISDVTFTFCGYSVKAERDEWAEKDYTYTANFLAGKWGGSGLKTITAEVTTSTNETYTFDVALVNLLIDPSGVITDENGQPLPGVTVVCQVYEDGKWVDLDAASIGQVNPQITDADGRYGWNVPPGQYRVLATKDGYQPYDSSLKENFDVLDIPPARNDINFSMVPLNSTYSIIPTLTEGVDVSVSNSAKNGDIVTMTVVPAEGLLIESVKVRTLSGTPVEVAATANNTYSFKMPAKDVTFQVTTVSRVSTNVEITSADASGSVTIALTKLEDDAVLFTAFYAENGQMVGLQRTPLTALSTSATAKVALTGTADYVRVFLLSTADYMPLVRFDDYQLSN